MAASALVSTRMGRQSARGHQNPILVGLVLLLAGVSIAMIQYKVPTIMTSLMAMFSMSAKTASWLMSIFTLVGIFIALPSGKLAQKYGAKRMAIIALSIAVLGSLIGLMAGTSVELVASRAVEGVALAVLTTCCPILIKERVPSDRAGVVMGIFGVWGSLGSVIAAVLTPTLFEAFGFSGLWIAYAAVTAIAAVAVFVLIEDRAAIRYGMGAGGASSRIASQPRYRELFTKDIVLFFVGFIVFCISLLAILSFVPTILQMHGFSPVASGLISTLPMLLSLISSPVFGIISDKTGKNKVLLVASLLVTGPCAFLLYTNTGVAMWAAAVLMGLVGMGGVGMFLTAYMRILPRPELAPIAMGVMVTIQGIGQFLGTFLVQILLGPDLTNWFLAGSVLLVLGLAGTASLLLCGMK